MSTIHHAATMLRTIARDFSNPERSERCSDLAKLLEQAESNERRYNWMRDNPGSHLMPYFDMDSCRWTVTTLESAGREPQIKFNTFDTLDQAIDFASKQ